MKSNMELFSGRSMEADSTVMPQLFNWIDSTFEEIPQCTHENDHAVILFLNLPFIGVIGASEWDFAITLVANLLNRYRRNSAALIVHPNRAAQKKQRHRSHVNDVKF